MLAALGVFMHEADHSLRDALDKAQGISQDRREADEKTACFVDSLWTLSLLKTLKEVRKESPELADAFDRYIKAEIDRFNQVYGSRLETDAYEEACEYRIENIIDMAAPFADAHGDQDAIIETVYNFSENLYRQFRSEANTIKASSGPRSLSPVEWSEAFMRAVYVTLEEYLSAVGADKTLLIEPSKRASDDDLTLKDHINKVLEAYDNGDHTRLTAFDIYTTAWVIANSPKPEDKYIAAFSAAAAARPDLLEEALTTAKADPETKDILDSLYKFSRDKLQSDELKSRIIRELSRDTYQLIPALLAKETKADLLYVCFCLQKLTEEKQVSRHRLGRYKYCFGPAERETRILHPQTPTTRKSEKTPRSRRRSPEPPKGHRTLLARLAPHYPKNR